MSEKYALHAVIIKKPTPLTEAQRIAGEIIKDANRNFYRETDSSYRFRNISKQKFAKKSFRTKKVNKQVSLVYGKLLPEYEHLEGGGLFDLIKTGVSKVKEFFSPRLNDYNNRSKQTLEQYGSMPIKSLTIYRTPISTMLNTALNLVSLGKWNELRQKYGFDKLFHLALVANVGAKNIIMEKNEAVNISTEYKTAKDTETFNIDLGGRLIQPAQMLETARKNVGDRTFFDYDAFTNNCQNFIKYLLEGQGLYSTEAKDFLFQDIQDIYRELPSYVPKVAKAITTTGAIFNKISGQGADDFVKQVESTLPILNQEKTTKAFYEYVKKHTKDEDVGLYVIQRLYPAFLKSKELAEILKSTDKAVVSKKAKKKAYDAERYKKKKGGARKPKDPKPEKPKPKMRWVDALKAWNAKRNGVWCVPRKGTKDYDEVRKLMMEGAPPAPAPFNPDVITHVEGGVRKPKEPKPDKPVYAKTWIQALKEWNKDQPKWCVPKRGSAQYEEVLAIRRGTPLPPPPPAPIPAPTPPPKAWTEEFDDWLKASQGAGKIKIDYDANHFITRMCIIEIMNRYKDDCVVLIRDQHKTWTLGVNFASRDLSDPWKYAYGLGRAIDNCVRRKAKMVIIPYELYGHQNAVIYRVADNTFEHFEPHGSVYQGPIKTMKDRDKGIKIFKEWIQYWEEVGLIPVGARYIGTDETCPNLKGFQAYDTDTRRDDKLFNSLDVDTTKKGFCQMWSIFYFEMCLKFPNISGKKLVERGLEEMKKMGPGKFTRHIVGYTKDFLDAINKSKVFSDPQAFTMKDLAKSTWDIVQKKFKELAVENNPHLATADTERVAKLREYEAKLNKENRELFDRLAKRGKAGPTKEERVKLQDRRDNINIKLVNIRRMKEDLRRQAEAQDLPVPTI